MMQRNLPRLPPWVAFWLLFSALVCIIDASFIIFRPHTLPGGKWNYLVKPYNIYIEVDGRYKDIKDDFVPAVSWMNLVEVVLDFITLAMHMSGKRGLTLVFAFMVSTMTFSKTVLYFLVSTSLCGGQHYINHDDWRTTILVYYSTNGTWVVVPFLCMVAIGRILIGVEEDGTKAEKIKSG